MGVRLLTGDCRAILPTLAPESAQCCVTSPPYWGLRSYLPDGVRLKADAPASVIEELESLGVACPMTRIYRKSDIPAHLQRWFEPAELGLEPTPEAYVANMVGVFREVKRVLRDDGTLWLNLGNSYNNRAKVRTTSISDGDIKEKDLVGIPWMVAFALRADGWYLRSDIIWAKPNPMPENVTDRPTKSHEYIFLLTKSARYFYDAGAIAEPLAPASASRYEYAFGGAKTEALIEANKNGIGQRTRVLGERDTPTSRNARSVWTIATQSYSEAHFAIFPPALAERCIKAGTRPGDTVLDPFGGAGTVGLVADRLQRNAVLIELNPAYCQMGSNRIRDDAPLFAQVHTPQELLDTEQSTCTP